MSTTCMPGPPGNQKKTSGPLELEVWVVVSHPVGSGNQVVQARDLGDTVRLTTWVCHCPLLISGLCVYVTA